MANYYDKVLEDFDFGRESEGVLDEYYDEGIQVVDRRRGRSPLSIPGTIRNAANFGRNVASGNSTGGYATKAELKNSLNSISDQVNDLKKSSLGLASSVKRLDDTYESVIKSIARKDKAQDSVSSNASMMSMLGAMMNRPSIKEGSLTVDPANAKNILIADDAVEVDMTKTLLFTMMPNMMGGSGGSSDMMMPLIMVMMLDKDKGKGKSKSDSDTMMLVMMMMMMNKK